MLRRKNQIWSDLVLLQNFTILVQVQKTFGMFFVSKVKLPAFCERKIFLKEIDAELSKTGLSGADLGLKIKRCFIALVPSPA